MDNSEDAKGWNEYIKKYLKKKINDECRPEYVYKSLNIDYFDRETLKLIVNDLVHDNLNMKIQNINMDRNDFINELGVKENNG